MKEFQFKPEVAMKYGLEEAVFIHRLSFYVEKNEANNINFFDGHYWSYDTLDAYTKIYPFWSRRQIERIIASCEKQGAILSGVYNKKKMDRTKWYTLSDEVKCIYTSQTVKPISPNSEMEQAKMGECISPNGEMELRKSGNAYHQTVTAIPVTDPVTDTITDESGEALPHARKKKKDKPDKLTFGELENVKLDKTEFEKLVERFGKDATAKTIDSLSLYIGSTGRRYKSHYATVLKWIKSDQEKKIANSPPPAVKKGPKLEWL